MLEVWRQHTGVRKPRLLTNCTYCHENAVKYNKKERKEICICEQ